MSPLLRELLSRAIVVGLMGYCYWLGRERHADRLRKAEAAIARVRAIKPSPGVLSMSSYVNAQDDGWDQAIAEVRAALDTTEETGDSK
jgi:hypothetical protein